MIISSHLNLILAVLVLIFVGGIGIQYFNGLKNAKKNAKYTVAYVTSNWHPKNNNGAGTDFVFNIKGEKFNGLYAYRLDKGKKYILLYDSLQPENYILLYDHQLPDTIKAPVNGWVLKDVPVKLDSGDLKAYFHDKGLD